MLIVLQTIPYSRSNQVCHLKQKILLSFTCRPQSKKFTISLQLLLKGMVQVYDQLDLWYVLVGFKVSFLLEKAASWVDLKLC